MKLGIFAKTFDGADPSRVLPAVAAAGFAAAQYNMACSAGATHEIFGVDRVDYLAVLLYFVFR